MKNPYRIVNTLGYRGWLNWMADAPYLKLKYRGVTGRRLNLKDPKTFSEKIQWLKLHHRRPEHTIMVDKYAVKDYVKNIIGEEHIVPTYGVWDSFDQIDFDSLPEDFVLKCTHDSGGLVVCRDKRALDMEAARKKITECLKRNYYWQGREWPYKNVKPRVIAEKRMTDAYQRDGLTDYKFFCFNGEPRFLSVSFGLHDHATASSRFLTIDWQFAPFWRSDYPRLKELPRKPDHYDRMLEFARTLSKDAPFVRVDMYEVDGKVYFSELTFSPRGGMIPWAPAEWDETFGSWIRLPEKK